MTKVWRPSSENIFDLFNDLFSNKLSLKLSIADYYSFEIFLSLNLSLIKVLSRLAFSLYFSYKLSMFKVICFINYSSLNSFLSRKFIPYSFFRFYNSADQKNIEQASPFCGNTRNVAHPSPTLNGFFKDYLGRGHTLYLIVIHGRV